MSDFSEEKLLKDCPHCDPDSFALKHPLEETGNFWVICDVHPISKGHVLIIPKKHLSCIGEYPENIFKEFTELYKKFSKFIAYEYGSISTFEHGKISQTVFHSHVHLLPFKGKAIDIVPEGMDKLNEIKTIDKLKDIYKKEGNYLFFSIGNKMWVVDTVIAKPRFFRDRFANALGSEQKGNWKEMDTNEDLMSEAKRDISELENRWSEFGQNNN
ncbi:MAG TPA: HIT domain-containing protein [Candidatus Saccharimonadales bacterium]|nr:HIT domain-containing protein [Candidatus Saccharimonadales bacterium]